MTFIQDCLAKAWSGEVINEETLRKLCSFVIQLLIEEPNVTPLEAPITIVGDINGMFYEMRKVIEQIGKPPDHKYLFLGNYANKGFYGLKCIAVLVALKACWPDKIIILRGNHECRSVTQVFGFYDECIKTYGHDRVWKYFSNLFEYLPIAACIDSSVFCVHGGLSPYATSIDQIRTIERNVEYPHEGIFCDILWSDPDETIDDWTPSPRGAGWLFGGTNVDKFLNSNGISFICRGHKLQMQGYSFMFDEKLVTVWSTPNHCFRVGNPAAVMQLSQSHEIKFYLYDDMKPKEQHKITTII